MTDAEVVVPRSGSASPENDIFAIEAPLRPPKPASTRSLSFDGLLTSPLLLHEDLQEGCGGQLWPAGMVLTKYMLAYHPNDLKDKCVIEIGAGGGLVGLAVAKGCTISIPILITDQQPMLSLMRKNILLNDLDDKVTAQVYDWGTAAPSFHVDSESEDQPKTMRPHLVLAADCVYFEPAFPLLLRTLQDLIGPDTLCYFCFKKRRKADWRFIRQMQKNFNTMPVAYKGEEADHKEGIYLYEVRARQR